MMRRAFLTALALIATQVAQARAHQNTATDTSRAAANRDLEARTSALAAQLRCPVCQGLSLQDSPSELAQSMRAVVRDQLASGQSPAQVKAYFVSKYGEWILLAPEPRGFNLIAYGVPVLVVLGGGLLVAFAVRRWTSTTDSLSSG